MYFKDRGGKAVLSSSDGVRLDITDAVAPDVVNAVPVPGKARADLGEIPWIGSRTEYKGKTPRAQQSYVQLKNTGISFLATFDGIFKDSTRLIMWSSCCF